MPSIPLVAAVLSALLFGAEAQAQAIQEESPRNWVLEVQLGSYLPEIDDSVSGTPFADTFGDSSLLTQAALQRLFYKGIGTLGLGVQAGYTEFYGRAFIEGSEERSGDRTSLHVVPLNVFAEYRFDYAAREWNIPFAVYGKAGFGYWFWWTGGGDDETDTGDERGTKAGFILSAGLALHLDWFDPRLSNEFDREFGVNSTYLYVDYTKWNADYRGNIFKHGFDRSGLDLSDEIISGGLAFEF